MKDVARMRVELLLAQLPGGVADLMISTIFFGKNESK